MAANIKKFISAGFDRVYYARLDGAGYAFGTTGVFVTGASGAVMQRLDGVKTADVAIPEPQVLQATGDDQALGTFIFPPNELPAFTLEAAISDLTFQANAQSTLIKEHGRFSMGVLAPSDPTYPDFALILQRRSKSKATGTNGVDNWEGLVIPKATIVPLGSAGYTERELAVYRYRITCNISDIMPWGETITEVGWGTLGGSVFPFSGPNRMVTQAFYGDNTTDTFNLSYTPATEALTDVLIYVNGAAPLTTGATVDADAKTIEFTTPPATNDKIEVVYEQAA